MHLLTSSGMMLIKLNAIVNWTKTMESEYPYIVTNNELIFIAGHHLENLFSVVLFPLTFVTKRLLVQLQYSTLKT